MDARAVSGIPWTLLSYVANRVVTVLTTVVLARLLVPADFGLFALATLTESVLGVFTGVWLGAYLVIHPDAGDREKGTVLTLLIAASLVFTVVLVAIAPLAAAVFDEPRLTGAVIVLAGVMLIN